MCIIYYGLLYRQTLFIEYIICVGTDCVILAGSSIVIDINDKENRPFSGVRHKKAITEEINFPKKFIPC